MTAHAGVRLDDTHPLLHRSIQSARFVHCVPREQITNLLTSLLFRLKRLLTERIDNHIFSCQEAFPLLQRQWFNDKEQIVNKNKCMMVFVRLQLFFVPFLSGEKHHISYISQKTKKYYQYNKVCLWSNEISYVSKDILFQQSAMFKMKTHKYMILGLCGRSK